jgi:hypothetical protein
MTRGGHGLPRVSRGLAMPYTSTERALQLFQGWRPTGCVACGPLLPLRLPTLYAYASDCSVLALWYEMCLFMRKNW